MKTNKIIKKAQKGTKTSKPLLSYVGDFSRSLGNVMTGKPIRNLVSSTINRAAVATGNETVRNVAAGLTGVINLPDAINNRIHAGITSVVPSWTAEKAQIKKGQPTVTVDKTNHLVRYYDANGKQVMAAPAGTGLISGNKSKEGDNKTPNGTYSLRSAEKGVNKKGGEMSFGKWFYRTNHTNKNGGASGVGLHGTGNPFFNGINISHGCIRTDNSFINKMHDQLAQPKSITIYEKQGGTISNKRNIFNLVK